MAVDTSGESGVQWRSKRLRWNEDRTQTDFLFFTELLCGASVSSRRIEHEHVFLTLHVGTGTLI